MKGDVTVSQTGTLAHAIRAITTPASWNYQFQLYIPIFSTQPQDINFYLTETGPIVLTETVTMIGESNVSMEMTARISH